MISSETRWLFIANHGPRATCIHTTQLQAVGLDQFILLPKRLLPEVSVVTGLMFQMIHFIGLSSTICLMSLLCRVSFRLLNTAFSSEIHFANGMYIDSFSCLVTPEMKYFLSKGNRLRYIIMRNLIILINVRLNNYFANLIRYYFVVMQNCLQTS